METDTDHCPTRRPFTITRDAGANVKTLLKLEQSGLVICHDVMLENGRENRRIRRKIRPVLAYPYFFFGEGIWADKSCRYDAIASIIGRDKVADVLHLEAHLRHEHDVFVTEDKDFLSKRDLLQAEFGCQIMTPDELTEMLRPKGSA